MSYIKYINTEILEGNIYDIIDIFCNDLIDNLSNYYVEKREEEKFKEELLFIIMYIKYDFINKEYELYNCKCIDELCKKRITSKKFDSNLENNKTKYISLAIILEKFINIFIYIYKTTSGTNELNRNIMIIIYGLYNILDIINILTLYITSLINNLNETGNPRFTISKLIIFLNYKKDIRQRYYYSTSNMNILFDFDLMHKFINNQTQNIKLYEFAVSDMLAQYNNLVQQKVELLQGGLIKNKYKKTENKITVIYNKKKYTRVIYIFERKKYIKLNKTFMLLSKLKKI